jgi:protocatechuate 3,4-dioxygenase beta subunit
VRHRWIAIWLALLLALTVSAAAQGDKKHEAQLRTVHGSVLDKGENPVGGAVVYLKNVKTLSVKTYIADDSGRYRFSGLDPNVDYEIHAEKEAMISANRTISSFDSRKDIPLSLKLDKKKENK